MLSLHEMGGAAWQRQHPGTSVWITVNSQAIRECTGPNGKPTVAQFCAFAVLADGQRVGEEHFAFDSESRFFDREYALPATLVQGKGKLTIRFEATGTTEVAPVYTLRLIHR